MLTPLHKENHPVLPLSGIYLLQILLLVSLFLLVLMRHRSHNEHSSSLWDICHSPSLDSGDQLTSNHRKEPSAKKADLKDGLKQHGSKNFYWLVA